jgi:hypothetical protein
MISHASFLTRPASRFLVPRLLTGLALLWVAMTGTVLLAPRLALATSGRDHPDYAVIAGTGLVLIVISSLFLAFASRVAGLGAAWLGLAVLNNGLILAGGFALAPYAFYQTTFVLGDPLLDVTSATFFPTVAGGLFLLHAGVLAATYALQRRRVRRELGRGAEPPGGGDLRVAVTVIVLVVGIPLLAATSLALIGYGLVVIAATSGAAVLVALLAVAMGVAAMGRAADESIAIRDTAIVTAAFWLALAMLLVFHVVWVVLMAVLVGIWPLKTVAPSGK